MNIKRTMKVAATVVLIVLWASFVNDVYKSVIVNPTKKERKMLNDLHKNVINFNTMQKINHCNSFTYIKEECRELYKL